MKLQKNKFLLQRIIWTLAAAAFSSGAWAASSACTYNTSGTGIGGTGARPSEETPKMQAAGNIVFSRGTVEAQSMGRSRPLAKGAQVCVGETITTADSGMVQIRMLDTGFISVRAGTKMRIDAFQYNGKEDGTENSAIYLVQGAFRAVTGFIGHLHKGNYKIETPTATIGIRGTDHEPRYIPEPVPGQAVQGEPGTYDKVNSGGVVIRTSYGSVEVKPNQIGFAPIVQGMAPVILKESPHFYHGETGSESKSGSSESPGNHGASKEDSDRLPKSEHTSTSEHASTSERTSTSETHAPDLQVPDVHSSKTHAHEANIPESQVPENQAPSVQAPSVQVPAVQVPAVQMPTVQPPTVQVPIIQTPVVQDPD